MSPTDATSGVPAAPEDSESTGTDGGSALADDVDPGAATVRTPPVTETDPLLVHVGEAIDEAKEAAREVYGEDGSGSEDDVDPNLGTGAPVP